MKYDVGFVLDVSGSLGPDDWKTETSFTKKPCSQSAREHCWAVE